MRLAIVGASVRAAAFSALSAGFDVTAADLFADSDLSVRCRATRVPASLEAFADWLAAQRIDAWMYTGSWENYPATIDQMAKSKPLLGNRGDVLRTVRSIEWLERTLAEENCHFPESRLTPPPQPLVDQWLVKPIRSAGGIGIARWEAGAATSKPSYWQRHIEGTSVSAAFVAAKRQSVLLGVTEQLIGTEWAHAKPYHYAGSIGPLPIDDQTHHAISRAGNAIAFGAGIVGLFGIDFVVDPEGRPWVVEVNPRYTASMEIMERVAGQSFVAAHVWACLEGKLVDAIAPPTGRYSGKAYLFARQNTTIDAIPRDEVADIPRAGSRIKAGKPICTVFASAREFQDVKPRLQERVSYIEQHVYS